MPRLPLRPASAGGRSLAPAGFDRSRAGAGDAPGGGQDGVEPLAGNGVAAVLARAGQARVEPLESQRGPALDLVGVPSGGARRATAAYGESPVGAREPLHQCSPTSLRPALVHLSHPPSSELPATRQMFLTAVSVTDWAEHVPRSGYRRDGVQTPRAGRRVDVALRA